MSATSEKPADATAVRPFRVEIPQAELDELRRRIVATRWPDRETVDDGSQGTPLAKLQELVFPGESYQAPRSWAERAYPNLSYFNAVDRGGHFAAWQEPQLFSEQVRAAFRSLR
jgi:hypothetical protein